MKKKAITGASNPKQQDSASGIIGTNYGQPRNYVRKLLIDFKGTVQLPEYQIVDLENLLPSFFIRAKYNLALEKLDQLRNEILQGCRVSYYESTEQFLDTLEGLLYTAYDNNVDSIDELECLVQAQLEDLAFTIIQEDGNGKKDGIQKYCSTASSPPDWSY